VSTPPTPPKVLLTAGQTLTAAQVAYVAQLEARARRLVELVDVDLADELNRERTRALNHRRHAHDLKAELARARKRVAGLRARNRRLLALLRTIHPRKENPMPLPDIERLQAIDLQPGDVLVATVPADLDAEAVLRTVDYFKRKLPGQQVLVVTSDIDLAAYRPVPIEAQEATTDA
jgi:hypothetical protein